ncbi:hypothetical protein [Streptomyces sp. NPDC006368]|uniref:hypothetical protein n=1 Tax=Streptomyces sp. NPDC006368 TaxID=3156760 RepID=UPI0033AEBD5C
MLRALAVTACVPYLALKVAWVAGSRIGVPDGSGLLDHRLMMAVVNGVSVLMDSCVVVLALLLTQRWGRRVRAWLLAVPMWVATGLLAPIMAGFPVQLVAGLVTGGARDSAPREPFLHEWVFGVVYGGFIVQGVALGGLFALYARDRWGYVWRGRPGLSGTWVRAVAVGASALLLVACAVHLTGAFGVTPGPSAEPSVEPSADFRVLEGVRALFAVTAVAGALALVFGAGRSLPVRVPLGLAWVGSGAVGCWGGYLTLVGLLPQGGSADGPTGLMTLTYAGEMISGLLLAACVAVFLRRRAADTAGPVDTAGGADRTDRAGTASAGSAVPANTAVTAGPANTTVPAHTADTAVPA